jgi:hypothetical protein
MPHRVNSLVSMVFASSLAAAMLLGATWAALAAEGCIDKPDREVKQAGHWYYYYDRVHHRRCWFFETSEATVSPRPATERTPAPNADSEQSWFSRFATGLTQTFSPEPKQNSISAFSSEQPQNGISDNSSSVMKTTSPKRLRTTKIARRDQPQIVPPPTTNGLANTEQRDQLPLQRTTEKDQKQTRQLTATERQELFEEFLKWYMDRGIFGQP